jgi:hypothetical protein
MERRARTQVVGRTLQLLLGVGFLIYAVPPSGAPALSILLTRCAGLRSVSQAFRQVLGARSRVPATWYLVPDTRYRINAEGRTPSTEDRVWPPENAHIGFAICLDGRCPVDLVSPVINHRSYPVEQNRIQGIREARYSNHSRTAVLPNAVLSYCRTAVKQPCQTYFPWVYAEAARWMERD